MRQIVIAICFTLPALVPLRAQYHVIKLNSTFVVTGRPLGGFGYERSADSSSITCAMNFEVGRYRFSEFATANSAIESYQLTGAGLMPEVRHYLSLFGEVPPLGLFTGVFAKVRLMRQTSQHGISQSVLGYQLESPYTKVEHGFAYDLGITAGYKTHGKLTGLHAEMALGCGLSHSELYSSVSNIQSFFRFDLFLCGVFQSRKALLPDDFVW